MTYTSGQLIQAVDYNRLGWGNDLGNTSTPTAQAIGNHWGVGTGDHGLGQSTAAFAGVAPGTTVTAVQWSGLLNKINACLMHHGYGAGGPLIPYPLTTSPAITVGTPITAFATITSGSALAYSKTGSTDIALSTSAPSTSNYTGNWGLTAQKSLVFVQTVTFASGDAARYFFNAGGKIQISVASSAIVNNPLSNSWTGLCSGIGLVSLGHKSTTQTGNSRTPTILLSGTNGGYWSGTTNYVTHLKQFDSVGAGYYSGEWLQIDYMWGGSPANGGYPILYIKTTLVNTAPTAVSTNTSVSLVVASPATTYINASWGTASVASTPGATA